MSKRQILMLIGVWVLILGAPGFPPAWKTLLLAATGVGIVIFGYRMKPEGGAEKPKPDLPFTDHKRPEHEGPVA